MSARNWRPATPRNRCPYCDHPSWCRLFADGAWECMRTPNDTPCRSGGWMYWRGGRPPENWQDRLAAMPPQPPRPTVDADLAQRAYRALLDRCALSDDHHRALQKRG